MTATQPPALWLSIERATSRAHDSFDAEEYSDAGCTFADAFCLACDLRSALFAMRTSGDVEQLKKYIEILDRIRPFLPHCYGLDGVIDTLEWWAMVAFDRADRQRYETLQAFRTTMAKADPITFWECRLSYLMCLPPARSETCAN